MQVLEEPSNEFYEQYDKMITQFLWNGKCPKIKLKHLQNSIEKRGCTLVNLRWKYTSLKLAWCFKEDSYTTNQFQLLIPPELGIRFWDCTLDKNSFSKIMLNKKENDH